MIIDDQIKDEKLKYDINRETAKISALSSGKIHKYEYLTGEDILPSNQQQIIEQAKFTYSPLGKAFEKQIKTIKDQGEKQVEALNNLKSDEKLTIEKYSYDDQDSPFISKQKEIFNKLVDGRLEKMTNLDKRVDSKTLIYRYKGNTADVKFDEIDNVINIINKIWDGKKDLPDVKDNQQKFKSHLSEIKRVVGNQKSKKKYSVRYWNAL